MTLNSPLELYNRMVKECGLGWGDVTPFILEAVELRLDLNAILVEAGIPPEEAKTFIVKAVQKRIDRTKEGNQ